MDNDLVNALYNDISRWLSCSGNTVYIQGNRYTSVDKDITKIIIKSKNIQFYTRQQIYYVYCIYLNVEKDIMYIHIYPTRKADQNISIELYDNIYISKLHDDTIKITDEKFTDANKLRSFLENYVTKQPEYIDDLSCDNIFELMPISTIQYAMDNIYHNFGNLVIDI